MQFVLHWESKTMAPISDGCSYTDDNDICLLVIIGTRARDSNTEHEIHHKSYHYLNNYTCCINLNSLDLRLQRCYTRTGIFCMCDTPSIAESLHMHEARFNNHHHQSLSLASKAHTKSRRERRLIVPNSPSPHPCIVSE
jgi:hypothetical protein